MIDRIDPGSMSPKSLEDLKCTGLRFKDLRSRGRGKTDRTVKEDTGEKST